MTYEEKLKLLQTIDDDDDESKWEGLLLIKNAQHSIDKTLKCGQKLFENCPFAMIH